MDPFQNDLTTVARIGSVPNILDVVCRTTGMGFAAIARVTEDRWIACAVNDQIDFGLPVGGELKVESTICHEIRQHARPVIIDHVAEDDRYRHHHTPAMYGLQSYISMPIFRPNGEFFGTLCAIDPKPHEVSRPEVVGMFTLFAELIGFHLDLQERFEESHARLAQAQEDSALREQFIAVLGHDLRNPLASIAAGASLLDARVQEPKSRITLTLMQSSVQRMKIMIDTLMDFARGRLGTGLSAASDSDGPLGPILIQIVDELQSIHPGRAIELSLDLAEPIHCDRPRIGQLLSNLLGNALTHGDAGPVIVRARGAGATLDIEVINSGKPIPPGTLATLFKPFHQGDDGRGEGLGLGLYIASEIARSHNGILSATSTETQTRFHLQIPAP